jgi:tetratricopeptide (TPR) repeat protein
VSFFSQGKYEVSNLAYDECLKIDPLNAEAWYNMGVTYDLQRNYVAAVAVYNTATKINPSYQKSLINKNADIDRLDY